MASRVRVTQDCDGLTIAHETGPRIVRFGAGSELPLLRSDDRDFYKVAYEGQPVFVAKACSAIIEGPEGLQSVFVAPAAPPPSPSQEPMIPPTAPPSTASEARAGPQRPAPVLPWRPKAPHPVLFGVEYKERQSRWKTLLRIFLAIPQIIVVYILQTVFSLVTFLAWFAILFTGKYPRGLFDFNVGLLRWQLNLGAYLALLRDEYPPFSSEPGRYPLLLDIPYPQKQSRVRLFVRFITIVPNYIVFSFIQLAWLFVTMFAWISILITGSYPRDTFDFATGALRWYARLQAYLNLLTDSYPPYGMASTTSSGNELVSGIIGAPLLASYVALFVLALVGGLWQGNNAIVVQVSYASLLREEVRAPYALAAVNNYGVHVQLDGARDPETSFASLRAPEGERLISFRLTIGEYFGQSFRIRDSDFSIRDGLGQRRKPVLALMNGVALPGNLSGNKIAAIQLVFELDSGTNPVELRYQADRIEYSPFAGDPQVRPIAFRFTAP